MNDIRQDQSARNTLLALADEVAEYDPYICADNRAIEEPLEDRIERACGLRPDDKTICFLTSGWTATGYTPLRFITSMDAAAKLVPEAWTWMLGATGHAQIVSCRPRQPGERNSFRANGCAYPAQALCVVALRARAEMLPE